jgi:uncharacterized membrane protein
MGDQSQDEDEMDPATAVAVHTIALRISLVLFVVGVAAAFLGYRFQDAIGEGLERAGLALVGGGGALALTSWCERAAAVLADRGEKGFPRRYRVIAWSLVALAIAAFIISLWYTTSLGLTTW